jgi:hypothetical protein
MNRTFHLLLVAAVALWSISYAAQGQELVQNGDFSDNTAGATTYNMSNTAFTSIVAFCRGFGTAQEIDLIYGSDNGPPPLVGNTKLRLHRQTNGSFDAFSTTLLSPVVASTSYRLRIDVVSRYTYTETNLQVGISSSPSSFGTLFQSIPVVAGAWESIDVILSAPVGGGYLTFRPDPDVVDGLVSVTNVSLTLAVDSTYSVGGSVAGLTGTGLALQNNGTDTLAVAADGPFTFVTELADSSDYLVTVSTQPTGQTCTVSNESGTIASADVTDVTVVCVDDVAPTYSVAATVAVGSGSASCNPSTVSVGGSSVCTAVPDTGWQVSSWGGACAAAGTSETCTLDNIQADQTSTVSFEAITYTVAATVAVGNGSVSCDPASVPAGGSSTCTAVPDAGWQVSAWTGACAAAGTSTICTLDNIVADQTSTVSFEAAPVLTYPIEFTVSGLTEGPTPGDAAYSVELLNNGGDSITVYADGVYSFPTELADGATYDIAIRYQPDNQTCEVANGNGKVAAAPVTDPTVTCVDNVAPPVVVAVPVPVDSRTALALLTILTLVLGLAAVSNRNH